MKKSNLQIVTKGILTLDLFLNIFIDTVYFLIDILNIVMIIFAETLYWCSDNTEFFIELTKSIIILIIGYIGIIEILRVM